MSTFAVPRYKPNGYKNNFSFILENRNERRGLGFISVQALAVTVRIAVTEKPQNISVEKRNNSRGGRLDRR